MVNSLFDKLSVPPPNSDIFHFVSSIDTLSDPSKNRNVDSPSERDSAFSFP